MTTDILPPLSDHQKGTFEELHRFDMERLAEARKRLEQAQKEVEYWEKNEKASSAVAARVMVQRWHNEDAATKAKPDLAPVA